MLTPGEPQFSRIKVYHLDWVHVSYVLVFYLATKDVVFKSGIKHSFFYRTLD